ncbi:LamG-like jellyroll fold domain-containing protein [Salinimicrobium terrae]|uniref:LamG-like jellyroll fold domain-containing protein n=1 Tax=Salinimicrobium terrae TaxID=470866 RepID=UPI000417A3AE|nr:LamG-like jellyroll fold domain-containing protein [Salinimicrobium terrae]
MEKLYNSLKISGLLLLLSISALASYGSYSASESYEYPQNFQEHSGNWMDSPYGIFAVAFQECNVSANITTTDVTCKGAMDGVIGLSNPSGGSGSYQYSINNGSSWQDSGEFTGLGSGNYQVLIADKSDTTCQVVLNSNLTISEPTQLTLTGSTTSAVSCNGGTDGSATAGTVSGGNSAYTYSINSGAFSTSKTFSNLSAGDHIITVKDSKGCEVSETVTVTEPAELTLTASTTTAVSCNGGTDGSAMVGTVSGGNSGYTYSINNGSFSTNTTFNNLAAGDHVITVKDSKGCEVSETVTVTEPAVLTLTASTTTAVSCNGGTDGTATAGTVSGGNSGYTFSINNGAFSTSKTFSNLAAGDHVITVKDSKGCEATETVTVTEPDILNLTGSTTTAESCNGGTDGSATAGTVSGGNSGYTYSINAGAFSTSKTFSNLAAGDHVITVKDSKGCEATEIVTVSEPDILNLTGSTTTVVSCNGGTDGTATVGTVAGGNSDYTYSINGGTFSTTTTFSNLAAGDHLITVKDSKGCEITETVTVTEPAVLTLTGSTTTVVSCNGGTDGTVTAGTVSGGNSGYTYSINSGAFSTSKTFSNLSAGDHIITVKDSKGCEAKETVTVTEPDVLTLTASTTTAVSCNGGTDGTATAGTVTGGNSGYTYSINGGAFSTSKTFSNLSAGDHVITVKDNKGCEVSETVTVTEPAELTLTASTTTAVSCNGGTDGTVSVGTVAGGNSGYTYSINNGSFSTNTTFNNLAAGDHVIKVKDSKGCEVSETVTVTEPAVLTLTASTTTAVSCNGGTDGTATAGTVTGGNSGYTFSINSGAFSTSKTFGNLSAGDHVITVKDSKGCEVSETVTVTEPAVLTLTGSTTTAVSCNGGTDGTVTAGTVTGGNLGYTYSINSGAFSTSKTFDNLSAGDHLIIVKDSKGCEATEIVTVTEPDELTMTTDSSITDVTCNGGNNGVITAGNITGGTAPYSYSLDNSNFTSNTTFENVSAGNHTIFVTDANGCALQVPVTVLEPEILNATLTKTDVSCHGGSSGEILLTTPSGGHGTYEFSIDGTTWQSNANFSNLPAGSYSVSMRDAAFPTCVVVLNSDYILTEPDAPVTAEITSTRTTTYGTSTGSATVNPSGGTPGYTYEWRKQGQAAILQTTKTATNLAAGWYEATVTDSKGCKIVKELEIIDAIQAFILTRSTCEIEGDIDAIRTFHYIVEDETAYGGVAPYTYSWKFGDGAVNPARTGIGEFWVDYTTIGNKIITLTVTDSTGETYITTQEQYIGKCYNPCGKSSNIDFDPSNIYLGYSDGTRMDLSSADYCDSTIPKYIYLGVDKSANIYNPYIELTYIISNTISDVSNNYYISGCREKDDIDEDLSVNQPNRVGEFIRLTQEPINFNCGDNLNIDTFYITWTNVSKKECGANNNKFCWSTNEPLTVPTELRAEATPTHILCKGDSTGTITVKASGGFAPYSYRLSATGTSQTSNHFVGLAAGTYTIYVQDSAGVEITVTTTITEPATSISAKVEPSNPSCFGETGSATVTVDTVNIGTPFYDVQGTPYYKYLWNDPNEQTTATASDLTSGDFTVTVIDANGCQIIKTVSITQPEQLTVAETGPDQNFGCGFNNTILEANTPVTGVGTWTVIDAPNSDWVLADNNNPISAFSAPAGTYTLRWTIAHADGTCGTSSDMLINFKGECSTLDFDGIDDYVFIGDRNNFPSSNFTLEAWIKPASVQGIRTVVAKRNTVALTSGGYDLVINNGAPTFRWNGKSVSTSHKVGTDRWYHLAVVFEGSEVELYVDGIKVGNSTGSKPSTNSFPFLVGAMYDANNPEIPQNYFEGWIEELRVWNSALSVEQLRFMMNQRIDANGAAVKGEILPMDVPGDLQWSSLVSYYRLIAEDAKVIEGIAVDRANNGVDGHLRNIESLQKNTAPLPYISEANGEWKTRGAWDINIGSNEENYWTWPNDTGINGTSIDWNIAYVTHEQNSGNQNITLLGFLLNGGKLDMLGTVQTRTTAGFGNGLIITKYLDLGGFIDLNGESQLVQTEGSILVGSGKIQRDQQGTASSFNYNYWTSPVSIDGNAQNSGYKIFSVMKDGTDPTNPKDIIFDPQYHIADGFLSNPITLSSYWLHKFFGDSNKYSQWERIDPKNTILKSGEGFSMKGSSGKMAILDLQNYTFIGMPNNDTISLNITTGKNYLIGNPYPSAIDANEFILDNLGERRDGTNVFNGSLYFWSHFSGYTHYLQRYVGGYAVYNLSGGIKAIANDERINATGDEGGERPRQHIPVGQAFFVSSDLDESITTQSGINIHGGDILFKNSQRAFVTEIDKTQSVFHSQEKKVLKASSSKKNESRKRIWIKFSSPEGYHRQLLVTADELTTSEFDLGYDAALIENNKEDMYWLLNDIEFIIQGVPDFNEDRTLPLGIKTAEGGKFKIAIDELENIDDDLPIFVKDSQAGTYHNLQESDFSAEVEKGNINDRYSIVFSDSEDSDNETEGPDEGDEDNNGNGDGENIGVENPEQPLPTPAGIELLYSAEMEKIVIKNYNLLPISNVVLFNSLGQEIHSYKNIELKNTIELPVQVPGAGMYFVRVFLEDSTSVLKFLVN